MKLAEPQRLYRRIAERIRGCVLRGEWPVGTRLPPERDLSLAPGGESSLFARSPDRP